MIFKRIWKTLNILFCKKFFTAYSLDKSVQSFKHCSKSESNSIFDDVVTSNQKISKQVQVQRSRKSCWKIVWKKILSVTAKILFVLISMRGVSWFCLCFGLSFKRQSSPLFKRMIENLKKWKPNTLTHIFYFLLYWISYLQSDNPYSYAFIRSKVTLANRNKIPKKRDRGCVRRNDSADEFWLKDWIIWSLVSSFKSLQFKRVQTS